MYPKANHYFDDPTPERTPLCFECKKYHAIPFEFEGEPTGFCEVDNDYVPGFWDACVDFVY